MRITQVERREWTQREDWEKMLVILWRLEVNGKEKSLAAIQQYSHRYWKVLQVQELLQYLMNRGLIRIYYVNRKEYYAWTSSFEALLRQTYSSWVVDLEAPPLSRFWLADLVRKEEEDGRKITEGN